LRESCSAEQNQNGGNYGEESRLKSFIETVHRIGKFV